jgi:hypothetical protein
MANLTGFKRDSISLYIDKSPDSNIQYGLDFTEYLNSGDTILSATATLSTVVGDTAPLAFPTNEATDVYITSALVNVRVEGGSIGNIYTVKITIITTQGDTDSRSFRIAVKEKLL